MTLDFKKLVLNSVKKEMSIQHFECNAQLFKKEELPEHVAGKIREAYGETFLDDANYTLWFSGNNLTKETVDKTIFKICNNALGKAANNMNESDLKDIDLGGGTAQPPPETPANKVDSLGDAGADEANGEALADLMNGDKEPEDGADDAGDQDQIDSEVQDEIDGGDEAEDQLDSEIDDELSGDGDEQEDGQEDGSDDEGYDLDSEIEDELSGDGDESEDDESEEDEDDEEDEDLDESVEQPAQGEKFVFLKITMK